MRKWFSWKNSSAWASNLFLKCICEHYWINQSANRPTLVKSTQLIIFVDIFLEKITQDSINWSIIYFAGAYHIWLAGVLHRPTLFKISWTTVSYRTLQSGTLRCVVFSVSTGKTLEKGDRILTAVSSDIRTLVPFIESIDRLHIHVPLWWFDLLKFWRKSFVSINENNLVGIMHFTTTKMLRIKLNRKLGRAKCS